MTEDEQRFLEAICDAWPRQKVEEIEVSVNALWLGQKLGLVEAKAREVAESLSAQGFLHVRQVGGVILVHPTTAGQEKSTSNKGDASLLGRLMKWAAGHGR